MPGELTLAAADSAANDAAAITTAPAQIAPSAISATNVANAATAAAALMSPVHASARAPTATDDSAHAYATLDTWVAPTGNFVCNRDTAGKAIWETSTVTKDVLPGDVTLSTGTSPYLLFGLRRMSRSYTTNACIDLARITGTSTVQTIGFSPDGRLDMSAAAAFLGGSAGRVLKWYDQSGRGQHAVLGSGLGPVLDLRSSTGIGASLIFDAAMNGTTGAGNQPNYLVPNVSLVIPNGQLLDAQNMSILFLGRARSNIKPCAFFSVNNNSGGSAAELSLATMYPPLTPHDGFVAYYETAANGAPAYQPVPQTPFVGGIAVTAGYRVVYVGDRSRASPGGPALTIGGNGMVVGGVGNSEFGYVEMSEIRVDTAGFEQRGCSCCIARHEQRKSSCAADPRHSGLCRRQHNRGHSKHERAQYLAADRTTAQVSYAYFQSRRCRRNTSKPGRQCWSRRNPAPNWCRQQHRGVGRRHQRYRLWVCNDGHNIVCLRDHLLRRYALCRV